MPPQKGGRVGREHVTVALQHKLQGGATAAQNTTAAQKTSAAQSKCGHNNMQSEAVQRTTTAAP
eukprot:6757784-Alexandrium_andersonii.AAC.1